MRATCGCEHRASAGTKVARWVMRSGCASAVVLLQVVKCALVMAMERKGAGEERLLALLDEGAREGLLSALQLDKGFARVLSGIDDLALDVPGAPSDLRTYLVKGLNQGWLTPHFIKQVAALSSRAPAASQDGDSGAEASQVRPLAGWPPHAFITFHLSLPYQECLFLAPCLLTVLCCWGGVRI